MSDFYKIRCCLYGHKNDVRCISSTGKPAECVISGSRDATTRVWKGAENTLEFIEAHCFSGHNSFISAICVSPPSEEHPHGLIYTGSNDKTINAYHLDSVSPLFSLTGHTNNVCSLACCSQDTLASGSWDKTAKLWKKGKCVVTFEGHESAVWAILIIEDQQMVITGSADKSIRMWNFNGSCIKTLHGHTDCVRGLVLLSDSEFVSCSNDASLRLWSVSGDCLQEYFGHGNFVYGVAALPHGQGFVSCGEDRTVRVWKKDSLDCQQTISHPTQSVWCVAVMANGDIVTGASDSVIRIFSRDENLQAPPEIQEAYEAEVASSSIPTQLGDIQKDQLPGPEALTKDGSREGQVMMVNDSGSITCYQWSSREHRWVKVGDVMGASGGTQQTSGKQLYEGQEYDFVFTVDIEEGKPPLKLPYNRCEDPWATAQTFIHKNNLSQLFLDQIANFIVQQVGDSQPTLTTAYDDPFTGSGRYVPGGGTGVGQGASSDPFTGAGRYVPGSVQPPSKPANGPNRNVYFPKTNYITFQSVNMPALLGKLKEFNSLAGMQLSEETMAEISKLSDPATPVKSSVLDHIMILLSSWPVDKIFPLLDVLRLLVRQEDCCRAFFGTDNRLDEILSMTNKAGPAANRMLVLRLLTNSFQCVSGREALVRRWESLFTYITGMSVLETRSLQVPAASTVLNLSVVAKSLNDMNILRRCLRTCAHLLSGENDMEAVFRLLVALGTLLSGTGLSNEAETLDLRKDVVRYSTIEEPVKVIECAVEVLALFP